MNENINLCEILKDCPNGTKLYSPLFGEVAFCDIEENGVWPIRIKFHNDDLVVESLFIKDGRHYNYPHGECLLLPSKDQRDWSKFTAPWLKKERFYPKTLNAFEKVIVRLDNMCQWRCDLFSNAYKYNGAINYLCTSGNCYKQCIPYNDDTKHLVGTTDEAPEYYRYWEE